MIVWGSRQLCSISSGYKYIIDPHDFEISQLPMNNCPPIKPVAAQRCDRYVENVCLSPQIRYPWVSFPFFFPMVGPPEKNNNIRTQAPFKWRVKRHRQVGLGSFFYWKKAFQGWKKALRLKKSFPGLKKSFPGLKKSFSLFYWGPGFFLTPWNLEFLSWVALLLAKKSPPGCH